MSRVAGLHCSTRGGAAPQALPLVVLPGLMGGAELITRLLGELSADRTVHCVDPLGSGESEAPDEDAAFEWSSQVERLLAVLDANGVVQADVLGLSMGGIWAQHALLRVPRRFRRAILCGTSARLSVRERAIVSALLFAVRSETPSDVLVRLVATQLFSPAYLHRPGAMGLVEAMLESIWPARPSLERQLGSLLAHSLDRELEAIAIPVRVLVGEHDWLMPPRAAERLAQRIPGSQLRVVPACGHAMSTESPEAIVAMVRA